MSKLVEMKYCLYPFVVVSNEIIKGQTITFCINMNEHAYENNEEFVNVLAAKLYNLGVCDVGMKLLYNIKLGYRDTYVPFKKFMNVQDIIQSFMIYLEDKSLFYSNISLFTNVSQNVMRLTITDKGKNANSLKFNLHGFTSVKSMFDRVMQKKYHEKYLGLEGKKFVVSSTATTATKEIAFETFDDFRWAVVSSFIYHIVNCGLQSKYSDFNVWNDAIESDGHCDLIKPDALYHVYYSWYPKGNITSEDTSAIYCCKAEAYIKHLTGDSLESLMSEMVKDVLYRFSIDNKIIYNALHEVIIQSDEGYFTKDVTVTDLEDFAKEAESIFNSDKISFKVTQPDLLFISGYKRELLTVKDLGKSSLDGIKQAFTNLRDNEYCSKNNMGKNPTLVTVYTYGVQNKLRLPITHWNSYLDVFCERIFDKCTRVLAGDTKEEFLDVNIIKSKSNVIVSVTTSCKDSSSVLFEKEFQQGEFLAIDTFIPADINFEESEYNFLSPLGHDVDSIRSKNYTAVKVKVGDTTYTSKCSGNVIGRELEMLCKVVQRQLCKDNIQTKNKDIGSFEEAIAKMSQ